MTKKDSILWTLLGLATTASLAFTYKLTVLQHTFAGVDLSGICGDETPTVFGLFDFSSAPGLLFYAYMPMAVIATLFALVLLQRKNRSLPSSLLSGALGFFVLWVLCILAQWLASYHTVLMFAWQLIAILEIGLYIVALYFAYAYVNERDLPFWGKALLSGIMLAVLALTPTEYNILTYNARICAGTEGLLWQILYFVVEPATIVAAVGIGISAFRNETDPSRRRHVALFTASFAFFMTAFALSNYFGELSTEYEMNFWGPLGLVVFFLMMGYMIIQRLKFHWQIIFAELLVWGLVTLVGTQFFYIKETTPFILNSSAFLGTLVFGIILIRSATVQIHQKEAEAILQRKSDSILHLASQKMRDLLTRNRFIFTSLLGGSTPLSVDETRVMAQQGIALSDDGLTSINELQNAESLKRKTVTLDLNAVDFRGILANVAAQKKAAAERKGLTLTTEFIEGEDGRCTLIGDSLWLNKMAEVFVDNAIKYATSGTITIGLRRQGSKALAWVKDTGPGIGEQDQRLLFTEGGHGASDTESLGFGLFIAKQVVDAHKGRVWVQTSPGAGTTFFVELPLLA